MSAPLPRRRVLLAAEDGERAALRAHFEIEPLRHWDVVEADSPERARFSLQLDPCDVLLLDGGLARPDPAGDWSWLTTQQLAPVLFVADVPPSGAAYWLPRAVARRHAEVLAVLLGQAADFGELCRRGRETCEALGDARRQVSRLVNLLWQAAPGQGRARWLTQRLMLERLEEEVVRARRYGGPLAVVLGELDGAAPAPEADGAAGGWGAEQISRARRRSDVAGQYGLRGFMLILPRTDAAGAAGCCHRLRTVLERAAAPGAVRAYLGSACFAGATDSVKAMLRRAEECLEHSRRGPAVFDRPEYLSHT